MFSAEIAIFEHLSSVKESAMQACKIKTIVPPDRRVSITLPDSFPAGPAEIIFLAMGETSVEPPTDTRNTLDAFFSGQQSQPCRQATAEEIDARIRAERDAWGD